MSVPKSSTSYPTILRLIVENLSPDKPTLEIPTPDLKKAIRYRILFYGYRTALRRELDSLIANPLITKSPLIQEQYQEKTSLLNKADSIIPRPFHNKISFHLSGHEPDAPIIQLPDGTPLNPVANPIANLPPPAIESTPLADFANVPDLPDSEPNGLDVVDLFLKG